MVVVHVSNPELEKWRQKDKEFKISPGYMKTTLFNYQKKERARKRFTKNHRGDRNIDVDDRILLITCASNIYSSTCQGQNNAALEEINIWHPF